MHNPRLSIRPTWDQYWIMMCEVIKTRSLDPHTQVGAIIVKDNKILSTGYNSYPRGCKDAKLPHSRPEKYPYMTHAEVNAIGHAGCDLRGSTIYLPFLPCEHCVHSVIAAGIITIKTYGSYPAYDNVVSMLRLLEEAGVKIIVIKTSLAYVIKEIKP